MAPAEDVAENEQEKRTLDGAEHDQLRGAEVTEQPPLGHLQGAGAHGGRLRDRPRGGRGRGMAMVVIFLSSFSWLRMVSA